MRAQRLKVALKAHLSRRRASRSLAVILSLSLLQVATGIHSPSAFADPGNIGSTTNSGTCSSYVDNTSNVDATFVNNSFCLLKFKSSASWTVPSGVIAIDMLVVGGGGGGGPDGGGGGGGGQVRMITGINVAASNIATVTVGTGGRGGSWTFHDAAEGVQSSVAINSNTYVALGGGAAAGATRTDLPNYAVGGYSRTGGFGGTLLAQSSVAADTSKGGRTAKQISGTSSLDATSTGYDGPSTDFTGETLSFGGGGGGGIWCNDKTIATFGPAYGGAGGGGRGSIHTQYIDDQTPNYGSDAGQPGTDGRGGGGGGGSADNDGGRNNINARTDGGRGGNGVVYIKFVPVVSLATDPQNASGAVGSTVTFTSTPSPTISGANRTKRWQVLVPGGSWADIDGATGSDTYSRTSLTRAMHGNQYRYAVTDTVGTAVSVTFSVAATLSVIAPLQSATDYAMSKGAGDYMYAYSDAAGANLLAPSSSEAFTVAAWIRPTDACTGYSCTIAGSENNWLLAIQDGYLTYSVRNGSDYTGWVESKSYLPLDQWSHVAMTRSSTTFKLFVNGVQTFTGTTTYSPVTDNAYVFYIGSRYGALWNFRGSIDEVKIWKSDRSSSIGSDMNSTDSSGMVGYWNFNEGTLNRVYNLISGATAGTDLTLNATDLWDADVISSQTTVGAHTVRTFKRTYLTLNSGWQVPAGVKRATVIIVGGGGGGGKGDNDNSGPAGAGGGGGVTVLENQSFTGISSVRVTVGSGGMGGFSRTTDASALNGLSTTVIMGSTYTALGGGGGGISNGYGASTSVATGGGSGGSNNNCQAGSPNTLLGTGTTLTAPDVTNGYRGTYGVWGWGGSGGGARGNATSPDCNDYQAGRPGVGYVDPVTSVEYGKGGDAGPNWATKDIVGYKTANNGWGGVISYSSGVTTYNNGDGGSSGVVVIRWITASKPIFTQPSNDTTTAGLTDSFTVSADPISPLIRNYQWQYSSNSGSSWSNITTGTGFLTNTYTTPTLETNTSGSQYKYRVIVTDSDTAGLSISETSTEVSLTINPRITFAGSYTAQKYGETHQDTFTISNGTGNKSFTYSPNNRTGISWSSPVANSAVLTIARTLSPGTYEETVTATDSKGAVTALKLSIVVNKADTITVTAIAKSDTYTGSTLGFTPTFTVTGLLNSDTVTPMTWSYTGADNGGTTYSASPTKPINAGSYTITPVPPTSLTDSYTAVSIVTAPLTINRATRTETVTVSVNSAKYGETLTVGSSTSAGSGDGTVSITTSTPDSCTVSSSILTATKPSGTCLVTATISRGVNYETATSSSKSITLSKADTLTVQVRNQVTSVYTGSAPATLPTIAISGLAHTDSATATRTFSGPPTGTCAQGGVCAIGDTGPGGGKVFYVASTLQSWGQYLEAAPANWSGGADSATANTTAWCVVNGTAISDAATNVGGISIGLLPSEIGSGYANTYKSAFANCTGGALYLARQYRGASLSDWYLPTGAELQAMATYRVLLGLINDPSKWGYWGSSDASNNGTIDSLVTGSWGIGDTNRNEATKNFIRPIRAFSSASGSSTSTVPIDVDTYTVSASLNFSSGALSNYVNYIYETSTLVITKAYQTKLSMNLYGAVAGSPFIVQVLGGSGDGALSYSISNGSTASNCRFEGSTLRNDNSALDQKACKIAVTKTASRNYFAESFTATVYFIAFVNNAIATQTGSGSTIALNGENSIWAEPGTVPTITSFPASGARGSTITINGSGFNTPRLIVEFEFYQVATSVTVVNGNQIQVVVPANATSGPIVITNSYSTVFSSTDFTVG